MLYPGAPERLSEYIYCFTVCQKNIHRKFGCLGNRTARPHVSQRCPAFSLVIAAITGVLLRTRPPETLPVQRVGMTADASASRCSDSCVGCLGLIPGRVRSSDGVTRSVTI